MIYKQIDNITEDDLQALIDNKVIERKTLEYKRQLPGGSDSQKKEFLADVSSFANASGGDIVYGIAERSGVPVPPLEGMPVDSADQEIIRLESMVRDGIRPRIPGIRTQPVPLSNSNVVIVLRVPKSWASPHRIEASHKFYSRSSNGKYELDVGELRAAFIASESLAERIRDFRADRIAKILAGETPVELYGGAKLVLHIIPLSSMSSASQNLTNISPTQLSPIHSTRGYSGRYNLEGWLSYSPVSNDTSIAYTQLFRRGIIEAVNRSLLGSETRIPSGIFEEQIIEYTENYLRFLNGIGIRPPIIILLTLLETWPESVLARLILYNY